VHQWEDSQIEALLTDEQKIRYREIKERRKSPMAWGTDLGPSGHPEAFNLNQKFLRMFHGGQGGRFLQKESPLVAEGLFFEMGSVCGNVGI
jgi:hypothetical protein